MNLSQCDALVLFGVTGDLAHKKLLPAIYRLERRHRLGIPVIGVASSGWSLEGLRAKLKESVVAAESDADPDVLRRLQDKLQYVEGDYREKRTFEALRKAVGSAQRPLHYLAIPPSLFPVVIEGLGGCECSRDGQVVVEKPFGRDLASAQALNRTLHAVFPESRIFRIDHFMGKQAVQNLLYFRFRLGPDVMIGLGARAKAAGEAMDGEAIELSVCRRSADEMTAYERLIGDALDGDPGLFGRQDVVEAAWRIIDPVLQNEKPVEAYEPGSWGPASTEAMMRAFGGWHAPGSVR